VTRTADVMYGGQR